MAQTTETAHRAERNKQRLMHAFEEFARGNVEILRPLPAEDFIEHSPGNPSGREAFLEFIARAPVARARLELKRVVADEQYVVMHCLMPPESDERGVAVVDIWRMDGDQIAEHWDVVQPVPPAEQIPHGMF